jgi:hypothetical protein
MTKAKLKSFKNIIQLSLNTKSVKVFIDGRIIITYRFKPDENLVGSSTSKELENKTLERIRAITNIKYRITSMQKEPSFCYNTYARILSISSSSSQDKVKRYLKHFTKSNDNKFILSSYYSVTFVLHPPNKDLFANFLLIENN